MPTPGELFDAVAAEAKAKAEADVKEQATGQKDVLVQTMTSIADSMKKTAEGQVRLEQRLGAIEESRSRRADPTTTSPDPYDKLSNELGVGRELFEPVIRAESEAAAERFLEKKLGPVVRENAEIAEYQRTHPDFDLQKYNSFVNRNPEVAAIVEQARAKGAVALAIEWGETRRQIDEKIEAEAKGQAKASKREQVVKETRPDAQIVGSAGANSDSRNVSNPLTPEKLNEIYAHADAGNWRPFEKEFHQSNLPSEEYFQRLVQS